MPKGFRPSLEPPSHRRVEREVRRPCFCLAVSTTVGLLIFLIFAVTGWNVYDHRYSKTVGRFHAGDEVSVTDVFDDFSDVFCEGYRVSTWERASAHLLPHPARVNKSLIVRTPITVHEVPTKHFDVMASYLLKGSNIDLTACRQNGSTSSGPAKVLVIKGDHGYQEHRKKHPCQRCIVAEVDIPLNASCSGVPAPPVSLHYNVTRRDTYYTIIMYGSQRVPSFTPPAGILVEGTLTRTLYELKDAELTCQLSNNKECQFDLPWRGHWDIVVRFNGVAGSGDVRTTLITRCQLRAVIWAFVFVVPPLVLCGAAAVFFGFAFCRKRKPDLSRHGRASRRRNKRGHRVDEQSALVDNEVIPQDEDHTITIQDG